MLWTQSTQDSVDVDHVAMVIITTTTVIKYPHSDQDRMYHRLDQDQMYLRFYQIMYHQ